MKIFQSESEINAQEVRVFSVFSYLLSDLVLLMFCLSPIWVVIYRSSHYCFELVFFTSRDPLAFMRVKDLVEWYYTNSSSFVSCDLDVFCCVLTI